MYSLGLCINFSKLSRLTLLKLVVILISLAPTKTTFNFLCHFQISFSAGAYGIILQMHAVQF